MNLLEGLMSVINVHPLFVHFPIALLLISTVLIIGSNLIENEEIAIAGKWTLILGSLSSISAVLTGKIAAKSVPHDKLIHNAMTLHQNLLIPMAFLSLILCILAIKKDFNLIKRDSKFISGLILMSFLLVLGADFGGKMVFKYGAGTDLYSIVNPPSRHDHDHGANDEEKQREGLNKHIDMLIEQEKRKGNADVAVDEHTSSDSDNHPHEDEKASEDDHHAGDNDNNGHEHGEHDH